MKTVQFIKSVSSIAHNTHINRTKGLAKHLVWQWRKLFNLFPFEQTISQSRICAAHRRCGVSALINSQGLYNYDNMKMLQFVLSQGGTFFDIGANIGSYTLIASELENAQVFSFEPHPGTFELLKKNAALNCRNNIRLFNMALGQSDEEVLLTNETGNAMNHIVSTPNKHTLPVRCSRVDRICEQYGISPQFVKIDVEGFEYDVLAGFGEMLKSVKFLIVEITHLATRGSGSASTIDQLLKSGGLTGPWCCDFDWRTFSPHRDAGQEGAADCIYLSPSCSHRLRENGFYFIDTNKQ